MSEISFFSQIKIFEEIHDFEATPMFVPSWLDERTAEPLEGLGPYGDQLPLDSNVTFTFNYTQGAFIQLSRTSFIKKL